MGQANVDRLEGTHFLIAADVAFAGSGVSINRHLYMIVTLDPGRHEVSCHAYS